MADDTNETPPARDNDPELAAAVRKLRDDLQSRGIATVSKELGLSREATLSLGGGFRAYRGTRMVLIDWFHNRNRQGAQ